MTIVATAAALRETADGIPYDVFTLITEKAGPEPVEPRALAEKQTRGKGFIEELENGRYRVRAKAQHTEVKNRNGRIYPREVWEQHLREGAEFQNKIGGRGVIGHLEHPEDGKSKMPLAAIVVTEAFSPDDNGEVWIVFETLSTPPGRLVESYIRDGVRFGLSSRGNGSVQHKNGVDEVQLDFDPITWDCVIDESTPGAEVRARNLRENIDAYVKALVESAGGDITMARQLAEADGLRAVRESQVDCKGGVCKCAITESEVPPSGFSRYLLAFEDGSAHYRAYQGTAGQWEVWLHPHNLAPSRLASHIPTRDAAQHVAENHYKLILASGHYSAQQSAAASNAIAKEGAELKAVAAPSYMPNISGMAGMMPHQPSRTPRIVLSFESTEARHKAIIEANSKFKPWLRTLQEEWKQLGSMPYSGTMLELEAGSKAECEAAVSALQKAGFHVTKLSDDKLTVYTSYEDGEQAKAHVCRVLTAKGIQKMQAEHVGRVSAGKVITENTMGITKRRRRIFSEYAPDKSAGGSMAGGDTVPDDDDEPDGISPTANLEDPEDLDLDLDVNEEEDEEEYGDPIDYDYEGDDDVDELRLNDEEDGDFESGIDYDGDDMGDDMGDDDDDYADDDYADDDDDYEMENIVGYSKGRRMGEAKLGGKGPNGGSTASNAMFAKAFSKDAPNTEYQKTFRHNNAVDNDRSIPKGDSKKRVLTKKQKLDNKRSRTKSRKESRTYFHTFNRISENKKLVGAVRVWFNESDEPVAYEYYDKQGILEGVRDRNGSTIYMAESRGRGRGKVSTMHEKYWRDKAGEVFRAPVFEDDLPARHGGDSGVVTKGDSWKGKEGPEYSMKTMNEPGDRGQDGDGQEPGDYDDASEEGDGEYVESTSFREIARIREENAHLRSKVTFMEDELARYEDTVQEQHEAISALRESHERETLVADRTRIMEQHPELKFAAQRLRTCESREELHNEAQMLLTLVEQAQPAPQPAPLVERAESQTFNRRGQNAVDSTEARNVPTSINESSSPISEGLGRTGNIGSGNVASRVAAARRRRRSNA